jgi:hypothetical protein
MPGYLYRGDPRLVVLNARIMAARAGADMPIPHGTRKGYRMHLERGEAACRECLDGEAAVRRRYERNARVRARAREAEGDMVAAGVLAVMESIAGGKP